MNRRPRLGRLRSALAVLAAALALGHTGAIAGASDGQPSDVDSGTDPLLTIVDQQFVLAPAAVLALSVQMPPGADVAQAIADGTVVVTSHRPVGDRTQVWDARAGSLPAVVDTIDIDIELDTGLGEPPMTLPAPTDVLERTPPEISPTARLSPTGLLTMVIPTETTQRTADALQFAQAGVHPLVVDVRRGDRTEAALITFVDRLDGGAPSTDGPRLAIGFLMHPAALPTIGRDGSTSIDDTVVGELGALADALEALADGAPGETPADTADTTRLPAVVDIDPAALDALASAEPNVAGRLAAVLGRVTLGAAPRLPLDPAAAAAGGQHLTYARLLDEGTDLLTAATGTSTVQRQLAVAAAPLSTGGAELLEATGTRTVVMPYARYSSLSGSLGLFTDTTRAIAVDGTGLRLVVIDPFLAERFDDPGDDLEATAISIVAELLVLERQLAADGAGGNGLVLARTDLGPLDPGLLARLLAIADPTTGLHVTDPAELTAGLDTMQVDGTDVVVRLPADVAPPDGVDPQARTALIDALDADSAAVSSMLDDSDPRIAAWQQVTTTLVSTAVDDELAAMMDRDVRRGHDEVRACVVAPERFAFTLTGRTSTIPFSITNRCDVPITVRVRLDSPKIAFPEGDRLEVLQPGTDTEVRVRAEARSNGRSSVFLRLFTPAAVGADQQLGPDVVLTARVQSFAGLGQLLLGTLVLVVAAWWLRHWRDARRRQALEANTQRHPASGVAH